MTDNTSTPPIIPLSTFENAFIKYFKCKRKEIEAVIESENMEVNISFKDQTYKIVTYNWLLEDVMDMLTDTECAQYITIDIWREATYGILSHQPFYDNLIDSLESEQEALTLQLSLSLSSLTPEKEKSFWNTLWRLDKYGTLFGKSIVAAAKTYSLTPLAKEILNLRIEYGESEYTQADGGIFDTLLVTVNGIEDVLYIYSTIS